MNLDQFAAACAKMGLRSIELIGPDQWPTLKKHGLICAMTPSHGIAKGLNRVENHDECLAKIRKSIDDTADAGFPNVICFSGNRGRHGRRGGAEELRHRPEEDRRLRREEEGHRLPGVPQLARPQGLHGRFDQVVRRVGPSGRLAAGEGALRHLPRRHDEGRRAGRHPATMPIAGATTTPAACPAATRSTKRRRSTTRKIMRRSPTSGYTGYVGQEFVPKQADAMKSLQQAVAICDV